MPTAFFVTGTDTEIGKTTVAAALLHRAKAQGYSTAAVKPVASDCHKTAEGLRNPDALTLWHECSVTLSYAQVNPVAFEPAIAPHLAAQEQNRTLTCSDLYQGVQEVIAYQADLTLIEGAGGWHVPLNAQESLSDLAQQLGYPVILVVGIRLGCINHALLTAQAISAAQLPLAGWIANQCVPNTSRVAEIVQSLTERLPAPCWGQIPYVTPPDPQQIAHYITGHPLDR